MLNTESFSQVFERLLEEKTAPKSFSSGEYESVIDPKGLCQVIELTQVYAFTKTPTYPVIKRPRPAHILDDTQRNAFDTLKSWAPQLSANFNSRELKSAFRISALKTHPDRGGLSETFQLVKKSYQILEALVKNEA